MSDLVPVHGGLDAPVDRLVPAGEEKSFREAAASLPRISVKEADRSTVDRIADGVLSPLTGFMDQQTFDGVLDTMTIASAGGTYVWGIPLSLPVTDDVAARLLRLPLYADLSTDQAAHVARAVIDITTQARGAETS